MALTREEVPNSLENVDPTKRDKIADKYRRLLERDWTRDNQRENYRETKQLIDNIEDYITGKQDEKKRYNKAKSNNRFDEIKEDFGGEEAVERLENQDIHPRHYATLGGLRDAEGERADINQKIIEWRTIQFELADLLADKSHRNFMNLDKKARTGRAVDDFEKYADSKVEDKVEREMEKMQRERQEEIAALKQLIQATRNETKHHRNHLEKFGKAVIEELSHIGEEVDSINDFQVDSSGLAEVTDNSVELSDFITEDGTVDISREQLEKIKNQAADETQDEGSEDTEDGGEDYVYELRDKPLDERKKVFDRMSDELDLGSMSQREIAAQTDIGKSAIFKKGKLLDKIEEEYGERYGL